MDLWCTFSNSRIDCSTGTRHLFPKKCAVYSKNGRISICATCDEYGYCFCRDVHCSVCNFLYFCSTDCPTNRTKMRLFEQLNDKDKRTVFEHNQIGSLEAISDLVEGWGGYATFATRPHVERTPANALARTTQPDPQAQDELCEECGNPMAGFCADPENCEICKGLGWCTANCPRIERIINTEGNINGIPCIELLIHGQEAIKRKGEELSLQYGPASASGDESEDETVELSDSSSVEETIYFRLVSSPREKTPPKVVRSPIQLSMTGPWKELYDFGIEDVDKLDDNASVYDSVIFHFYHTLRLSCQCLQQVFLCPPMRRYILIQSRTIRELSKGLEEFLTKGTGHIKHYEMIQSFITFVAAEDETVPDTVRPLLETYDPAGEYIVHFRLPYTKVACRQRGLPHGSFMEKTLLVRLPQWDSWTASNHRDFPPKARIQIEVFLAHCETFQDHPLGRMPKGCVEEVVRRMTPMLRPENETKCAKKKKRKKGKK